MKFHSATSKATTAKTFFELWNNKIASTVTIEVIDNEVMKYAKDALEPIKESVTLIHESMVESKLTFENRDRKIMRGGIKNCLEKILEECYAFYKEALKEMFLRESFNLIQGYIASEQSKIGDSNDLPNNTVDERNINDVYKFVKNTELVATWNILYKFLEGDIAKDEFNRCPGLLDEFDTTKLNFSYFKFDTQNCIDWELSRETWKSKSITMVQNYLKIVEDPTSLTKNVDSVYDNDDDDDDDDLKIADGSVSLQCKFTLQDYDRPMISKCGHTFDDKALKIKAQEQRTFKCLEGGCKTNLTYPSGFALDETMLFRMGCYKLISTK